MKRGTESRVFLGKDTSIDEFTGINVLSTVLLGKKEGGFKDHNGLFIASNVTLGKGIARIITVVVYGTSPLSLPNAIEADVVSLKAFGGTENVPETYIDSVVANGKCVQSNLPKEYIELESLTSVAQTGAYINTGIKAASTVKIEVVADRPTPPASGTSWYPFGALNDSTNGQIACFESTNSVPQQYIALTYGKVAYSEVKEETTGMERSTLVLDGGVLTYDNGTKTLTSPQAGATFSTNNDIWLFGRENVSVSSLGSVTIYSAKLWNNGVMVRNLVCAKRKSDNKLGMFDTVTQTFIECQGSFTTGAEITLPEGYTRLDYIVFDSTQVIDTGFTPDNDSRIESKCYRTGADCWFYGASPTNPRVTLYHSSTGTCRWGNQSRASIGFVEDTDYVFVQDKNGITANNTLLSWNSGTAGDFTCDRSLTIGNCNGATGTRYFAGNLYYMKIYDNDVLVRNFVPCQNASNVVGLYDTVNGVFYTDTGLVAGPKAGPTPNNPIDIISNNGVLKYSPNIFDGQMEQGAFGSNTGLPVDNDNWIRSVNYINVKPGSAYTVSCSPITDKTIEIYIVEYNGNGDFIRMVSGVQGNIRPWTTNASCSKIKFQLGFFPREAVNVSTFSNIQVEQGSTATAYNPHIEGIYTVGTPETVTDNIGNVATCENLLQAGTYTDTQSIIDGVVTRKLGVMVLTGAEEGWSYYDVQKIFYCNTLKFKRDNTYAGICTHYTGKDYTQITDLTLNNVVFTSYVSTTEGVFAFRDSRFDNTTMNSWKAFLAAQYAAGTPVMVIYPLVTATTESVAGQPLIKAPVTAAGSLAELTTTVVSSSHTTPTPSQPLDIRCNNGVLKATYNEFDASAVTNDYFYNADLEWVENSAVYTSDYMEVEKGKYTLVMSLPGTLTATVNVRVNLFNANKVIQSQIVIPITTDDPVLTQEVDIPSGISYVRISTNRTVLPISSFKSSNAVYVDGTQETIGIRTRNLFDASAATSGYRLTLTLGREYGTNVGSSDDFIAADDQFVSGLVPVVIGETYTKNSPTEDVYHRWKIYDANKIGVRVESSNSITIQSGEVYVAFCGYNTELNTTQLEQGSTSTDYVPYMTGTAVAEALLKVGTYADQQEIIGGTVTRKVGVKVFDGSESWGYFSPGNGYNLTINGAASQVYGSGLCSHLPTLSANQTTQGIRFGAANNVIYIYEVSQQFPTGADWLRYLADQYAAGTPVIIVYPLATATTESVTGQPMSCVEGDNTAEITQASMDGLTLEVTYLAGATVTIQEVENAQLSDDVDVTIH